jgi:hypothetical protein
MIMMFTEQCYIGIDPTPGKKAVAYAAIDGNLKTEAIGQGSMEETLAFAGGRQSAFVAVSAPPRPNQGILSDPDNIDQYSIPNKLDTPCDMRVGEYLLLQRNLKVYQTPAKVKAAKSWMQGAYKLYGRLTALGYSFFPADGQEKQLMETIPEACFQLWLSGEVLDRRSTEGRIQRQIVLYDLGLEINEPMEYYQEITRHRILTGKLPQSVVFSAHELTALAAAYMAWLAVNQPQDVEWVGDKNEGQIVLPKK